MDIIKKKLGICIVLYNPKINSVIENLSEYVLFVNQILLVDNSNNNSKIESILTEYPNVEYMHLNSNQGIAKAQNLGIIELLKKNVDEILFLDQDSYMNKASFMELIEAKIKLINLNIKIGGVGPKALNFRTNKEYIGRIIKGKPISDNIIEHNELISSGTIISKEVFHEIGLFEETLFIDGVDHEWCWRAKNSGYRFFVIRSSILYHQLGEGDRKFLGINFRVPKPNRTYYQYRNYFRLLTRNYVPIYWKLSNGFKYIIKFFVYSFFFENGKEYAKNIFLGGIDGIKSMFNKPKIIRF